MAQRTFNYSEWKKKQKEEEEKKAALTAQEKAMGGITSDDTAPITFNYNEWKRRQKAEANGETYAPVPPAAEYVYRTTGVMPSVVDVVNDDVYTGRNGSTAGGNKDSWFKSGGFSDGVDGFGDFMGDLGQTTAGTVGDVILGATVGFGRMFEGLYDLGVQGVSRAADALGADEFAESAKEHANRDLMGEWAKDKLDYVDQYSVLGDKSDSVVQGLGQVGGIILTGNAGAAAGLGAGGVSALTTATTGLSSMGTNIGEAYKAGATDGQAFVYGLTTGAIEAGTELFFGGLGKGVKALGLSRGIGGIDDMLAKGLSDKITKLIAKDSVKKVVGNTIEALVKATGEGVEEVASGLGSALMKMLTYASEEDWEKLVADEKLLESFIVGAVTSGIMQGGDYIKANANKTDFVTGRTSAEEKVIQRAAEKEIAQKEANGEKLTKKQKNEIYDRLTEDISRGYISIDTIEEALGGDKYTEYKKASDENATLKKELDELRTLSEYDSLRNMKSGDRTDIQNDRLAELKGKNLSDMTEEQKSRLAELETKYGENTKTLEDMKKQMSDDVLNLVKSERKGQGSLLMESYNERERLKQDFVADYESIKGTKYEDAARKTIDNAIKAKLNNTNKIHDLVDMATKFSSETGVVYEFGGNEQIKTNFISRQNEKIAALEAIKNPTEAQTKELANLKDLVSKVESGKTTVNGNISKNGNIMINLDSPKALNRIVGHEMAHLLENAKKNGGKLQNAIFSYAKAKGLDLDAKLAEYAEIYNGVEGADAKGELTADLIGDYLFNDYDFVKTLAADRNLFQKMWDGVKYLGKLATAGSHEARELARVERMFEKAYQEVVKNGGVEAKSSFTDADSQPIDSARISSDESDNSYSLSHNAEIAEGQSKYIVDHKAFVTESELAEAQRVTNAMVDVMMKYSNILPEDKIGKVLTKNGSYDRSVENTTICVRTLAYNEFVDKVQEEIGRPLSQMESFLVSQKLFVIATDPQCMYCYVSLDRKAFNDMLLRYMHDRDSVMEKYRSGEWEDVNTYTEEQIKKMTAEQKAKSLYVDYLRGRDATKNQADRFNTWLGYVDNGTQILSLADIATEDRQNVIKANGGDLANQLADARKYAQSASWAKIQKDYVAYRDEILKLGDRVVKNLNEHYGLRWYSFSDYSAAFIVENMQQITDASIRGLKGLAYTKDTDFAEIYAPSGMNINVSVFVKKDANGEYYIDERQSANLEKALELRGQYPNVGIVATVTDDDALKWAASQEWSDVIIPFHIVRTGTDVADYYKWLNYTGESGDTVANKDLWNAYLDSLNIKGENARKKVSKNVYPSEHHNDKDTYLNLCESRGLTPRFARFAGEDWYMKLVNETRLSADESTPLKPIYNEEAAKASFQKFVDKGGYEGGWYKEGVDVDAEAKAVAEDILAGKKANEVDYGRQDIAPEELIATRKTNRKHGQYSLSAANGKQDDGTRSSVTVYHGSNANFDSFDFTRLQDELGVFFAEEQGGAMQYGDAKAYTLTPKKTLVVHQGEEYRRLMQTGETDVEKRNRLINEGYDTIKLVYNKPGGGETVDWVALTPDVINVAQDIRYSLSNAEDIAPTTIEQYSLSSADTQQADADYALAVERGDTETAQRMVDEAAKAAGYNSPMLYHGTGAFGFTQIDTKKSNDRISFFATDSMQVAGTYSGTSVARNIGDATKSNLGIYQLYANTDGMIEFDAKGAESNHIELGRAEKDYNDIIHGKSWYSFATAKQLAKYAKQKGYTGVIIKNVVDSATPQSRKTTYPSNVYIFFDSAQIKSADPVTYDDSGNVIPLSERFKSDNNDIRYSLYTGNDFTPIGSHEILGRDARV